MFSVQQIFNERKKRNNFPLFVNIQFFIPPMLKLTIVYLNTFLFKHYMCI
nr:MAG TPA: hypothetical protein [Caudoviricetes sp.]